MAAVKIMEAVLDKEEDIKAELNVFENHSHHPNIVSFYGAFVKRDPIADDQLWIVMEVNALCLESSNEWSFCMMSSVTMEMTSQ